MSVVIKGKSIRCTEGSRNHYMHGKENEHIRVHEVKGFATQDAETALTMVELSAKGTRCQKPLYSVKLNPETDRPWSKDELNQAMGMLETNLGLTGHPRVVVEHLKKGRVHYHVLWSRFHPDGGPAKNMGNDYAAHQKTQKEIEKAFKLRPMMARGRDFKQWEVEWAKRYGFDIFKLRDQITADFNKNKNGQQFKTSLEAKGIILCRGDKSQFVLILPWGQHKALSSMIVGRPTKGVLRRALGDIDINALPTVREGKAQVKANLPKPVPKPRSTKAKRRTSKFGTSAHTYIRTWRPYGSFVTRHAGVAPKPLTPTNTLRRNGLTTGSPASNKLIASAFTNKTPVVDANGRNSIQVQVQTTVPGQNKARHKNENTKNVAGRSASNFGTGGVIPKPHAHSPSTSGGFVLPPPILPFRGIGWMNLSKVAKHTGEERQQPSAPFRPASGKKMSPAQEADLNAVYLGLMSYAEYCRKWGVGDAPTL